MLGLLLSLTLGLGSASCPGEVAKSCICEYRMSGFFVTCRNVTTELNGLLSSLEKLRVDRLTVIQSSWPALKRLSPLAVRSMRLIDCSISEIQPGAFAPLFGTLEELVLANNSLTKFPALGALPKLRMLNLNNNKLQGIPEDAFDGIGHLRQLRLEGNQISELPSNVLSTAKHTLDLLDLSGNKLTRVPSDVVSNAGNLMYLDLSENKISGLACLDFRNLPQLVELRLNDNELANIESLAFKNVPQLRYFYLQKNLLGDLDALNFVGTFPQLEVLDLSNNALTKVPTLESHQSIRQVRLDFNKIGVVESRAFSSNPTLQLISLQNNGITSLAEDSFHNLNQLTILLLENNLLGKLDGTVLKGSRRLQQLSLSNNSFEDLADGTFQFVPELKIINLAHCGLVKISKNLFLPTQNLVWLDLSRNSISSFEQGTFEYTIPNILLAGNPLHCDEKLDWFVEYMVRNQVRIRLSNQPEVVCVSPEKFASVRLEDLVVKKAQDASDQKLANESTPNDLPDPASDISAVEAPGHDDEVEKLSFAKDLVRMIKEGIARRVKDIDRTVKENVDNTVKDMGRTAKENIDRTVKDDDWTGKETSQLETRSKADFTKVSSFIFLLLIGYQVMSL